MALAQSAPPETAATLARQIQAALAQGARPAADAGLDKLLAERQLDSSVLLRTGIAFAQKGMYPQAARTFTRCVHDYPALFEGYYNLALAELSEEHYTRALAAIDEAPQSSQEGVTARTYLRGKIEAAMGGTQAAEQDLAAAFAQDPAQENYALDLGLVRLRLHEYPGAERVFAQGSALNPRSTYLLLGLALAQFLSGRTGQSTESAQRVLAADPAFSPARLLLGFTLYFDGNFPAARQVAGKGLRSPDADPYLYYLEAATLLKQHDHEYTQILGDLALAEKKIPDCALCYVASGKVHEEQSDLPGALADLDKAVRLQPDLSEGWYHLAAVNARLGNAAEAAQARQHFQTMKANQDEQEKEMMRGVVIQSLGGR